MVPEFAPGRPRGTLAKVNTEPFIDPSEDDFEPSQPPQPRRLRRLFLLPAALAAVVLVVLVAVVGYTPEFYAERLAVGGPFEGRDPGAASLVAEQAARRLVTSGSTFHAAFLRVGRWESVFTERELNAWLAIDLPQNHASLLPDAVTAPRVQMLPGRVRAGFRLGQGILSATVWIEAEVVLRQANQVAIRLAGAWLGGLPLPKGFLLDQIARRLERLGTVTETRRIDNQKMLLVYIPSTHQAGGLSHWLEAIRIASGELALAGETRQGPVRAATQP